MGPSNPSIGRGKASGKRTTMFSVQIIYLPPAEENAARCLYDERRNCPSCLMPNGGRAPPPLFVVAPGPQIRTPLPGLFDAHPFPSDRKPLRPPRIGTPRSRFTRISGSIRASSLRGSLSPLLLLPPYYDSLFYISSVRTDLMTGRTLLPQILVILV